MKDEPHLTLVSQIVSRACPQVERIPPKKHPQCDLWLADGKASYLIEVKSFGDDSEIRPAMRRGEVYFHSRSHYRSASIESSLRYGIKQLQETRSIATNAFCLVAVINRSVYGHEVVSSQILGCLYGTREIIELGNRPVISRQCLYFSHSLFWKFRREVDAAIVLDNRSAMLCLNDFSTRADAFTQTKLATYFKKRGALNDVKSLECSGFLFADCSHDRNQEGAILEYLKGKYHTRRLISVEPEEHSAMALCPSPS